MKKILFFQLLIIFLLLIYPKLIISDEKPDNYLIDSLKKINLLESIKNISSSGKIIEFTLEDNRPDSINLRWVGSEAGEHFCIIICSELLSPNEKDAPLPGQVRLWQTNLIGPQYSFTDTVVNTKVEYSYQIYMREDNQNWKVSDSVRTRPDIPALQTWYDAIFERLEVHDDIVSVVLSPFDFKDSMKNSVLLQTIMEEANWGTSVEYVNNPDWIEAEPDGSANYTFEFDMNYYEVIKDKKFKYRARIRDGGYISRWSAEKVAQLDITPPEFITSLKVEPKVIDDKGWFEITWNSVTDRFSPVSSYQLYRMIGENNAYALIDKFITGKSSYQYSDSFSNIQQVEKVFYKVGAADIFDNKHDESDIDYRKGALCLWKPQFEITNVDTIIEHEGNSWYYVNSNFLEIKVTNTCQLEIGFQVSFNESKFDTTIYTDGDTFVANFPSGNNNEYEIKVRAVFREKDVIFNGDDGENELFSLWSEKKHVIRYDTVPPVTNFEVYNSPPADWQGEDLKPWEGDIYLRWTGPPSDLVEKYKIYRGSNKDTLQCINTLYDVRQSEYIDKAGNSLITFQHYWYSIKTIDIFGNGSNSDTLGAYCARAPRNLKITDTQNYLNFSWDPPTPYLGDIKLEYTLDIYKDDTYFKTFYPLTDSFSCYPKGDRFCDYSAVVFAENRSDSTISNASEKAYFKRIFPIYPELQDQSYNNGIFIWWENYWEKEVWQGIENREKFVDTISLERYRGDFTIGNPETTYVFDKNHEAWKNSEFWDRTGLNPDECYGYRIIFKLKRKNGTIKKIKDDRIFYVYNDSGPGYVPLIETSQYGCDRNDALFFTCCNDCILVKWCWQETPRDCCPLKSFNGADSIKIYVSNNENFNHYCDSLIISPDDENYKNRCKYFGPLCGRCFRVNDGDTLYLRTAGVDKWGHQFFSDTLSLIKDTLPPAMNHVNFRHKITAIRSDITHTVIDSFSWKPAEDNISGIEKYIIKRIQLDDKTKVDSLDINTEINNSYTVVDTINLDHWTSNLAYEFKLIAQDYARNRESVTIASIWKPLPAPDTLIITDLPNEGFKARWPKVQNADSYIIEWTSEISELGTFFLKEDSSSKKHWIDTTAMHYNDTIEIIVYLKPYPENLFKYVFHILAYNVISDSITGETTQMHSGWSCYVQPSTSKHLYKQFLEENYEPQISYHLSANYPNPFNSETKIHYSLPEAGMVQLIIFNSMGQEIIKLVDNNHEAGNYSISWDGNDKNGRIVSSGIYFYKLKINNFTSIKKCIRLR